MSFIASVQTNKLVYIVLLLIELEVLHIQTGYYLEMYEESDVWERLSAVNLFIVLSHLFQYRKTFEKEVI